MTDGPTGNKSVDDHGDRRGHRMNVRLSDLLSPRVSQEAGWRIGCNCTGLTFPEMPTDENTSCHSDIPINVPT